MDGLRYITCDKYCNPEHDQHSEGCIKTDFELEEFDKLFKEDNMGYYRIYWNNHFFFDQGKFFSVDDCIRHIKNKGMEATIYNHYNVIVAALEGVSLNVLSYK